MGDEESFGSAREKDEAAVTAFSEAQGKASERSVKNIATLGEAQALLGLGRYEEASQAYSRFIDTPEGAEAFLFLAYEGLGLSLEGEGKLDEAMQQFQALEAVGEGRYKTLAMYHQARVLEAQDKDDEAASLYKRLSGMISEAPKMTPMLGYLQERIAGKAGVPQSPGMGAPGGDPGMIMGPGGQMIPTGGGGPGGMGDLSPEEIERFKQALQKIQAEQAAKEAAGQVGPPPAEEPPAPAPAPEEGGEEAP
jgi:tetratricopeptide (TPR) repeat protein